MADFRIQSNSPELQRMFRQNQEFTPRIQKQDELKDLQQSTGEVSFRESVKNFIHDVDSSQKEAAEMTKLFMAGILSL